VRQAQPTYVRRYYKIGINRYFPGYFPAKQLAKAVSGFARFLGAISFLNFVSFRLRSLVTMAANRSTTDTTVPAQHIEEGLDEELLKELQNKWQKYGKKEDKKPRCHASLRCPSRHRFPTGAAGWRAIRPAS
jgi:hypothetical protein